MHTQTTQVQPALAGPAPTRRRRSGTPVALVIAGTILALAGSSLAAVGGGVLALFGSDGRVDSGRHSLSTSSTALVSDVADLDETQEVADVLGSPRVRLTAHATGPTEGLFVGLGPAEDVQRYLAGVAVDEVSDIDIHPYHLDRRARGGTRRPARPASQSFWVAQGSGADSATLRWKVREGEYRMVVMNADGKRGVRADGDVGLTAPNLPEIAWTTLGAGVLLLIAGVATVAIPSVARSRRQRAESQ